MDERLPDPSHLGEIQRRFAELTDQGSEPPRFGTGYRESAREHVDHRDLCPVEAFVHTGEAVEDLPDRLFRCVGKLHEDTGPAEIRYPGLDVFEILSLEPGPAGDDHKAIHHVGGKEDPLSGMTIPRGREFPCQQQGRAFLREKILARLPQNIVVDMTEDPNPVVCDGHGGIQRIHRHCQMDILRTCVLDRVVEHF